jgi:hypothetical protein
MTGDDFEESEYAEGGEEEEFQESEEPNVMRKREETVFCPRDGEYMPYKVKGALVVRRCPKCGYEKEGSA